MYQMKLNCPKIKMKAHLLHGFGLGSRAYSGHRQTHVDGWADTLVEQLGLQEDLRIKTSQKRRIVTWNVSSRSQSPTNNMQDIHKPARL